jgi:hypothetical protein
VSHRPGNRQVVVDGQRWHLPKDTPNSRIPLADPVGDQLQATARQAAGRWDSSLLTQNERRAISEARASGEPWRAHLLERQARGRFVENQVRQQHPQLDWSRKGADAVDPATGIKYDILSGTRSNLDVHAKRMSDVQFRMIDF